jgi:hypothetical protein
LEVLEEKPNGLDVKFKKKINNKAGIDQKIYLLVVEGYIILS